MADKMTIDKDKANQLANLKKPTRSVPAKKEPTTEKEPELSSQDGYAAKEKGSYRDNIRNFILSPQTIEELDDIIYDLKKTIHKRVSASEIVRVAISHFAKLDKKERNSYFID
jgi:hypothetical protein